MICTEKDCNWKCDNWENMKLHYKLRHPEVERPDKYFETTNSRYMYDK